MLKVNAISVSYLWLILWFGASLNAQTSQVSGRIQDSSKAALSGAKVTLTRTETGDHRQVASNQEGYYNFPLLLPGIYEIRVEKDGFETQTRTAIRVETGTASTVDLDLVVGSVAQSVTVDAAVPLLKTETAAVNNVVQNEAIVAMPLIDRRSAQADARGSP